MVLCVYICNERTAGGTRAGWIRAEQAGGAGAGGDAGPSQRWSHSFSCLGAQAGDVLPAPDGMELLHSGATQAKSPQACPHYYKRDRCFLCHHTPAAVMRLFRIKGRGNTTNRKSKRTRGKEQRQLGSSDTWTDTEHGSRAATWHRALLHGAPGATPGLLDDIQPYRKPALREV